MGILFATVAAFTLLAAPTLVAAQVNYELLTGYGQGGHYFARVISFKDNKFYHCTAVADPKVAPTLRCTVLPGNYKFLTGNNVKTVQTRSSYNTTAPWDAFWQIDQALGDVNFCSQGAPQGMPTPPQACASFKIP